MTASAEALILENLDLVEKVASRVAMKMPPWVEMDDLVSWGNLGLCHAAERFDPERHCSFRAYAMLRIRGSMIDAYRGKNYPRLTEQMPVAWLQGSAENDQSEELGEHGCVGTPDCLVDKVSVLDLLISAEESVVVSIDAVRARSRLNAVEGRVLDRHLRGDKMRDIGRRHGRSAAWARYTMFEAKRKLREALLDLEEAA